MRPADLVAERPRLADASICGVLAAATVAYLWFWPRDFFPLDEGLYLYESRRLLDGDVFYRDIFELITPGSYYAMALVFRIFGVDLTVARMAMAAVHAAIAILVFLCCRQVGVRRSFACVAALAHLAVAYPAMSKASPHWFGTLLTLLVLYALLLMPWRRASWRLLLVGLANGGLIMVQQQKGVVIAAGVVLVLVLDHLLARRDSPIPLAALGKRLVLFLGAAGTVAGLSTLFLVWRAGLGPLWDQLILVPLNNYSGQAHCSHWGFRGSVFWKSRYPFPEFVRTLPFIAGLGLARFATGWVRRVDPVELRRIAVPTLLAVFATLSVYYCPNHIHLGIIAPVPMVLLAETAEALFAAIGRRSRAAGRAAAWVAVAVVLALLLPEMRRTMEHHRRRFSFAHYTAAGLVHFRNLQEIAFVDAVRRRADPGDEVFAYATYPGLYFLTGTKNPTRFQFLLEGYSEPRHYREVLEVLETRKTRFIAINSFSIRWKTDPIVEYLGRAYRRVPLTVAPLDGNVHFLLFERDNGGAGSSARPLAGSK